MSDQVFGRIMPVHFRILQLVGWDFNGTPTELIADDLRRVAEMRLGRADLEKSTGWDFGFDLQAWRTHLLADKESGYTHPYGFKAVDKVVLEAIADPVFIRLAKIADVPPDAPDVQ